MKNVTITLDEAVAQWARVEAAKAGMSLSRWIGNRLADDMRGGLSKPAKDLEAFLSGPGWPSVPGPMPKREDLYDRPALLRHKHSDLRPRPKRAGKAPDRG